MLGRLSDARTFSFDLESTGLDPMSAQIVGFSFSPAPGEAYYVPVGHVGWGQTEQMPIDDVIGRIKLLMEDSRVAKVAHNANLASTYCTACHLCVFGVRYSF